MTDIWTPNSRLLSGNYLWDTCQGKQVSSPTVSARNVVMEASIKPKALSKAFSIKFILDSGSSVSLVYDVLANHAMDTMTALRDHNL